MEVGNDIILAANETNIVLTKMQLSNPGPELMSDNDDEDFEIDNKLIEKKTKKTTLTTNTSSITNQQEKVCSTLNGHLNDEEKFNISKTTIATSICNINNNDSCIKNKTTNLTTINVNEEMSIDKEKYIHQIKLETNENIKNFIQNNYKRGKIIIENNEDDEYDIFGRKKVCAINTLKNNNNSFITSNQKKKNNNIIKFNGHYNTIGVPASTNDSLIKNNTNAFNLETAKKTLENEAETNILYACNAKVSEQNNKIISSLSTTTSACENFVGDIITTNLQQKNKINNNFVEKINTETLIINGVVKNTDCTSNNDNSKNNNSLNVIVCQNSNSNSEKKTSIALSDNSNMSQIISNSINNFGGSDGSEMICTTEANNSFLVSEEGGNAFDSSILIKNANIINDDEIFTADIYIENGIITYFLIFFFEKLIFILEKFLNQKLLQRKQQK